MAVCQPSCGCRWHHPSPSGFRTMVQRWSWLLNFFCEDFGFFEGFEFSSKRLGQEAESMYCMEGDQFEAGIFVVQRIKVSSSNMLKAARPPPMKWIMCFSCCFMKFHTWSTSNEPILIRRDHHYISKVISENSNLVGVVFYRKTPRGTLVLEGWPWEDSRAPGDPATL